MFRTTMTIEGFDPELSEALKGERRRQEEPGELTATGNHATPRVPEWQGPVAPRAGAGPPPLGQDPPLGVPARAGRVRARGAGSAGA